MPSDFILEIDCTSLDSIWDSFSQYNKSIALSYCNVYNKSVATLCKDCPLLFSTGDSTNCAAITSRRCSDQSMSSWHKETALNWMIKNPEYWRRK